MNVILAVSDNAAAQRADLIEERGKLLARVAEIGRDLAIIDAYEVLAAERDGGNGLAKQEPKKEQLGEAAPKRSRSAAIPSGPDAAPSSEGSGRE